MMANFLNNIYIILLGTTHPGNIGAAARAMKTMSCTNLRLVNPEKFPSAEATARAAGADDILANVEMFSDIKSAVSDCELVIATSTRDRNLPWPVHNPRESAKYISKLVDAKIAILFGRENSGLSNEEISHANFILKIPSNPEYGSLNLASAVQIICYEIFMAYKGHESILGKHENRKIINQEKMEGFYNHLADLMSTTGFSNKGNLNVLKQKIRCLFNRTHLGEDELNILRGFLSSVQKKIK